MEEGEVGSGEISERFDTYTSSFYSCADTTLVVETELKGIREHLRDYEEHLQALKDNKPFTPRSVTKGKKRKNTRGDKKGSPKKRRNSPDDEDDSMESDFDSDDDADCDSNFASDKGSDDVETDDEAKSSSDSEKSYGEDEVEVEATEEDLEEKIKETKEAVKSGRSRLSEVRKRKKEAVDYLSTLKKNITRAQKEKNAFCSLRRSEVNILPVCDFTYTSIIPWQFSRDVLKEDFRVGLKDLDGTRHIPAFRTWVTAYGILVDSAAEERNPDGFNPNVNLRGVHHLDSSLSSGNCLLWSPLCAL